MAEAKKTEAKKDAPLADGAASTDPAVQRLLAERDIAARNNDEAAGEAATARLAKLGYK